MAFMKYAKALVAHPQVSGKEWSKVRKASKRADLNPNLIEQASKILGGPFDPRKYLLTHVTIVASVDTEIVPGARTGLILEHGKRINRKYPDYRVTKETESLINSNWDCFPRGGLLKSYRTFIGGANYQEHVQVAELAKGKIIDAVPRDVGHSVYIDILVATHRKHTELIKDILSGRMGTLSMGCCTSSTTCTKCGHVAADETELCEDIRFLKGNTFYDEHGNPHKVAEICGHDSLEDGGVVFIEASWVATPAFTGAVLRNVLEPKDVTPEMLKHAQKVLSMPPRKWLSDSGIRKAANSAFAQDEGWGDDGGGEAPPETDSPSPESDDPFKSLEDDVQKMVLDRVKKKLKDKLNPADPALNGELATTAPNDNIVKQAALVYDVSVRAIAKTASNDADCLNKVAKLNESMGIIIPLDIYRTALKVGSMGKSSRSDREVIETCRVVLGRMPSKTEAAALVRLGKILSLVEGTSSTGIRRMQQE